jgi:hypothetical protein
MLEILALLHRRSTGLDYFHFFWILNQCQLSAR